MFDYFINETGIAFHKVYSKQTLKKKFKITEC